MLERFLRSAGRIPQDKLLHFAVGALLGALACPWGLAASIGLPLVLGLGKEVWDHFNPPHAADPADLLATLLGAAPVWAAYLLGGGA